MVPYTVKHPKSQWRRCRVLLLTLNIFNANSRVSIVNFEHEIGGWERTCQFYFYVACYLYITKSFKKLFCFAKL